MLITSVSRGSQLRKRTEAVEKVGEYCARRWAQKVRARSRAYGCGTS